MPRARHAVCTACTSVWQRDGSDARHVFTAPLRLSLTNARGQIQLRRERAVSSSPSPPAPALSSDQTVGVALLRPRRQGARRGSMQVAASQSQGSTTRGSPASTDTGGHRGSPSAVETGDHSAKKPRLEPALHGPPKQEIVAVVGAIVPAEAEHGPRMEAALKMDVTVLRCPICLRPLKPPVFQCKRGHMACGGCLEGACGRCEDGPAAFDVPNTAMDAVVSAAWIQCPHDGCDKYVAYHEVPDHQSACPHAPCSCTEPGCGFVGSAPALVAHLAAAHAMPVNKVPYGKVHRVQLTVPEPARRLLVGAGDEGGAFLLTLEPFRAGTVVTAVCVRAEACHSPRYTVKMWVNGPPLAAPAPNRKADIVLADFEATSSTAPGGVAFDNLTSYLTVPPRYLVEGAGPAKELSLHIRIERTSP